MSTDFSTARWKWLCTGREYFSSMLSAIASARQSVRLEVYIFGLGKLGEQFRRALLEASSRGVQVQVLIDALGSMGLPASFWKPLQAAGAEVREFNPLSLHRLGIRNHRKLLVCDEQVAFVGGFNIASEYEGDGVAQGWCDLGLRLEGPLVGELAEAFEEMFARADLRHKLFVRLLRSSAKRMVTVPNEQLLLSGPGRGLSPIRRALKQDLTQAKEVHIMSAYFLPPRRMWRDLSKIARRGGRVRVMLAGKSDVAVSRLATQSLYRRFLKAGLQIYEYVPQVLHAKLIVVDDVVYVGSANLDPRSLNLNYELMIRFDNREMAEQARRLFTERLQHCRSVKLEEWRESRTLWMRIKQRWAHFLLARLDPYIAYRQWRALPD